MRFFVSASAEVSSIALVRVYFYAESGAKKRKFYISKFKGYMVVVYNSPTTEEKDQK